MVESPILGGIYAGVFAIMYFVVSSMNSKIPIVGAFGLSIGFTVYTILNQRKKNSTNS